MHPDLRAGYIKRHNVAVEKIARAIMSGNKGRWLVVADLRTDVVDNLSETLGRVVGTRVPHFMLQQVPEEERKKMRPDLLFVQGMDEGWQHRCTTPHQLQSQLQALKARCTVYIVEVGYCRDHKAVEKRAEKKRQHRLLAQRLQAEGWKVEQVPIVLGHCGSVYKPEMDLLQDKNKLGISKQDTEQLFKELHEHAVHSLGYVARKYQELRAARNKELGQRWPRRPARPRRPP